MRLTRDIKRNYNTSNVSSVPHRDFVFISNYETRSNREHRLSHSTLASHWCRINFIPSCSAFPVRDHLFRLASGSKRRKSRRHNRARFRSSPPNVPSVSRYGTKEDGEMAGVAPASWRIKARISVDGNELANFSLSEDRTVIIRSTTTTTGARKDRGVRDQGVTKWEGRSDRRTRDGLKHCGTKFTI